jgi:hypothetical protein
MGCKGKPSLPFVTKVSQNMFGDHLSNRELCIVLSLKQREQYKRMKKGLHSFLTPYRLEKLEQLGFAWHIRTSLDPDDQGDDFPLDEAVSVKHEHIEQAVEPQMHLESMDV